MLQILLQKAQLEFLNTRTLFKSLKLHAASKEKVILKMMIEEQHLNVQGFLFGGVTSSLVDIGGSLAIAAYTNSTKMGVSTDLSTTFLRPAKMGQELCVHGSCLRVGKSMAFTRVELFADDKLIAFGNHSKFMLVPVANTIDSKL